MSVFSKRNAVVGYVTLKAAKRSIKRRRRRRSGAKLAMYLGLGVVSAGVLAGLVFMLLRRQHGEDEHTEGRGFDDDSEIVGEYVTASVEPIPAT